MMLGGTPTQDIEVHLSQKRAAGRVRLVPCLGIGIVVVFEEPPIGVDGTDEIGPHGPPKPSTELEPGRGR